MPRRRDTDGKAVERIKHRLKREALFRADPVNYKRGSDGRVTRIVEVTVACERCRNDFTYRMTTKPRRFCVTCCGIRHRELANENAKTRSSRREAAPLPPSRLIPYVGYDPTEQPLEGDHHEEDQGTVAS